MRERAIVENRGYKLLVARSLIRNLGGLPALAFSGCSVKRDIERIRSRRASHAEDVLAVCSWRREATLKSAAHRELIRTELLEKEEDAH